jgi:hypothetical protein
VKRLIILCLAVILCLPAVVNAMSIGEVETQGKGKFSVGFDQEFLFDRDMKRGNKDELKELDDIDWFYRSMAKINYGILENLDIYVKLGTANFKSQSDGKYEDSMWVGGYDLVKWKEEGNNAFAYGGGIKGAYNINDFLILGYGAQYLRHKNSWSGKESWDAYNGSGVYQYSREYYISGDMTFQEWQIACYVAKKLGNFTPYIGSKYSDLRIENKVQFYNSTTKYTYKSKADNNVGVFVGTDYKIGDNLKLNVEGRFVDETAMSFGATYKF